jgi:hypothetical protein
MSKKWKFNNGDLVRYCYRWNVDTAPDIGVVTAVDEFGDYRVVWTSGGIGWYSSAEVEELCKSET